MHKSSFFAFLAVFLLILLGIKGFHLLQYSPWPMPPKPAKLFLPPAG